MVPSNEIQEGNYSVDWVIKLHDNNIHVRLRVNGRVFDIEFGPENLHDPASTADSQPIKQQYLDALHHSFGDDDAEESFGDDEEECETINASDSQDHFDTAVSPTSSEHSCEEDPLISFAVGPFLRLGTFKAFAPESSIPRLNTLQDVLHPPLLSFSVRLEGGDLVPVNESPEKEETVKPPCPDISSSQHWLDYPRIEAKDVVLARASQDSLNPNLVIFNNRVCWFKPVLAGVSDLPYIREIDLLSKLTSENLDQTFRFPRLEAIVLDDRNGDIGCINGLILTAIYPNRGTIADWINGTEGRILSTTLCERWYHDAEMMIHTMHSKELVWGDVSPHNMIIDRDENVWVVDFGGGYSEGWISPENMETQKGDLEGLKRIWDSLRSMK